VSSEEPAEIRRLERENAELRRASEILKVAPAFFVPSPAGQALATPPVSAASTGTIST
jgi:transposase-like protein